MSVEASAVFLAGALDIGHTNSLMTYFCAAEMLAAVSNDVLEAVFHENEHKMVVALY